MLSLVLMIIPWPSHHVAALELQYHIETGPQVWDLTLIEPVFDMSM